MIFSSDDIRTLLLFFGTLFSLSAIIISLVSLYFTRLHWIQSNRPIIVAYIDVNEADDGGIFYNLVVSNIGNRPAVRIRLNYSPEQIKNIFEDGISTEHRLLNREFKIEQIENCFYPKSEIVLLENGEKLSTAFGATGRGAIQWLKSGSTIDISITYFDLDGRSFKSLLPLKVYPRQGFSGMTWGNKSS
ncbi:hypothetical protein [Dapis sp. BLCC M229]|uniref:hypothetical protein n=1 Tax=Dapis sp. BLCC M229 TaxID=3400188 RepID=UPI003CE8DD9B